MVRLRVRVRQVRQAWGVWGVWGGRLVGLGLALCLACVAAAAPEVPESAFGVGAKSGPNGDPRAEVRLLVDSETVRAGEPFRAGVLFDLDPGWHMYWRNSGESGLPTQLEWELPEEQVGPIAWPAPAVYREGDGDITTYGYADRVLLTNEIVLPADASGEQRIAVVADFLVCEIQCIPARIPIERTVRVGPEVVPASREVLDVFEAYARRVPVPAAELGIEVEALYSQSAIRPGDSFKAAVAVVSCAKEADCEPYRPGARPVADSFVPDAIDTIEMLTTGARGHPFVDGAFLMTLAGRASPDEPFLEQRLRGVLTLERGRETRYAEVDLPFPRAPEGAVVQVNDVPWLDPAPEARPVGAAQLLNVLALALLGGLILNLMPCVLPVLAIKVFGIAELAQHERAEVITHGLAYTLGIVFSMIGLGLAVIALRAAGTSVGWGFQFQEPLFIVGIATLLVVFALNLFGVFEFSVNLGAVQDLGAQATGPRRSFFEGLLAVAVATPCSAPFLGTAVGFAFASSAAVILAVFVAIGLGLALPYVLVTLVPAWAKVIPRSGPWMNHLRAVLGFALIGTVVWLLSVLGAVSDSAGLVVTLAFLALVSFAAWLFGALQEARRDVSARIVGVAAAVFALWGLVELPLEGSVAEAAGVRAQSGYRAFDPAEIDRSLAAGQPVFVYFTADWCLTCKVNERLVLQSDAVTATFASHEFEVFVADWTRRDETIRRELERFGRAAVPMYLVYNPARPDAPELLPEVITVESVVAALERASAGRSQARLETGR